MNVQGKLDLIEEVLDNGTSIPFSSKIAVDVDAIRTYVGDIRLDLPVEIEKAQDIVEHYNSIIKKASTEASVATSTAQKQADEIVVKHALCVLLGGAYDFICLLLCS